MDTLQLLGGTPPSWLGPKLRDQIVEICVEVSAATGVAATAFFMRYRGPQVVAKARQQAMVLVRERCQLSFAVIGETFAHRDHATVMHAGKRRKDEKIPSAGEKGTEP
jgi:chromosomal replication initiation ATPase DnaA